MTVESAAIAGGNGKGRAKTTPIRCAIYCRISVDDSTEQAFGSTDAQREAIEAYIQSQRAGGWVALPEPYIDRGFSGGTIQRPAFQRLMAEVEAGCVDRIVVHRLDRFSRSLLDFARVVDVLDRHDIGLVSVTQQLDTSTSMGRLTLNMLLSFAQFEREMIAERTRDKMGAARRKGRWTGGVPVLGYDVAPGGGRLAVDEAEAGRVRAIFRLYIEMGSLSATVAELRQRGWHAKRRTTRSGRLSGGAPFTKSSLSHLLSNVIYRGQVRYQDQIYEGEHDAIIGEDLWDQVHAVLDRNNRAGGAEAKNKHNALLKGLIHCGPCGSAMTPSRVKRGGREYSYYVCSSASKRGWATCPTKSLPAADIEAIVIDHIRAIGRDPAVVAETLVAAQAQLKERICDRENERRLIAAEAQQLDDEIRRVAAEAPRRARAARVAELETAANAAEERLRGITGEIGTLKAQEIDEDDLVAALGQFDEVWAALTPQERARVIHLLVEKVVVDGRTNEVELTFRPTGIKALAEENEV